MTFITDSMLNLDSLLIQVRSQVTPKWYEFGVAAGLDRELLEKYTSHPPEVCIEEMFDYWLRNRPKQARATWKQVAKILEAIQLNQLAEDILKVYETGNDN